MIAVLDNFHFDLSTVLSRDCLQDTEGNHDSSLNEHVAVSHGNTSEIKDGVLSDVQPPEREEDDEDDEGGADDADNESSKDEDKSKALALKIYRSIVKTILPNLQQVLTQKVKFFKLQS